MNQKEGTGAVFEVKGNFRKLKAWKKLGVLKGVWINTFLPSTNMY